MHVFDVKFNENNFFIIKKFLSCLIHLERTNLKTKTYFYKGFFSYYYGVAIDSKYERIQDGFSLYSRQHMPIGAE